MQPASWGSSACSGWSRSRGRTSLACSIRRLPMCCLASVGKAADGALAPLEAPTLPALEVGSLGVAVSEGGAWAVACQVAVVSS